MRPNSQADVSKILKRIRSGKYSRADIKLLLLEIREYLPKNSFLRDIANCVHPSRDRGQTFKHAEKHIKNFLDVAQNGGVLTVEAIASENEIIEELVNSLKDLNFPTERIRNEASHLLRIIAEAMDGTHIDLRIEDIDQCQLQLMHDNHAETSKLCFIFNVKRELSGIIPLYPKVRIAMPLFSNLETQ